MKAENSVPLNKKELSERDICTKYITPAVKQAGLLHPYSHQYWLCRRSLHLQ